MLNQGADDFNWAMAHAAANGHQNIVTTPQLTIRKPMAWLNDSTATSKPHLQHDLQHPLGRKNFHGFCWDCVPRFKEDIGSSSAELVYGTTLSLPGELIVPNSSPDPPHSSFLRQLRNVANSFRPTPTSVKHGTYMRTTGLQQARFVFVRHDAHKLPLQPPYDGPFPVVSRHTKHFLLDIGGRQDKVSMTD